MRVIVVFALLASVACGSLKGETAPSASVSVTPRVGLTPDPNAVPWRAMNGITACGVVNSYIAATPSAAGSLSIGSRSYTITPGTAAAGSGGFPPKSGTAMCVWGGLNGSAAASPNADPLGEYRCGRVRDYRAPTSSGNGTLKLLEYWSDGELELDVPSGPSIGTPHFDDYRCYRVFAAPNGDAMITGRDTRLADVSLACGRVKTYATATTTAPGVIGVGSKTFGLPAGVFYEQDPAGAPADPIAVGKVICLRAQLDDGGVIARYGPVNLLAQPDANGNVSGMCGRVVAFKAPSSNADGLVALALNSVAFRIPSGSQLTPLADRYSRCYDLALDAQGDVIAIRDKDQQLVGF